MNYYSNLRIKEFVVSLTTQTCLKKYLLDNAELVQTNF